MTSFKCVPVIDISILVNGYDEQNGKYSSKEEYENLKRKTAKELHEACKNVGFFYISGHGFPQDLLKIVDEEARMFFALPNEEKEKIQLTPTTKFRGYQKLAQNVTRYQKDWHEAIDLFKEYPPYHSPIHGLNLWPSNPPKFRHHYEEYIDKMQKLGHCILRGLAVGLELNEDYFSSYVDNSYWGLRIICYPPLSTAPGEKDIGVSCGEHSDYGVLTILNTDDTKEALQVKNASGDWIYANPIPGAFICNLGDMLRIWTNDMYQSTPHQVIHKGNNIRISMPFFFEPNFDAVISPIETCCRDTPAKYPPKIYGDHLSSKILNNFTF